MGPSPGIGIVSLFPFAGLEVAVGERRAEASILAQHMVIGVAALVIIAGGAALDEGARAALDTARLALQPFGFILDARPL